jgi:predicted amidohydrolase
MENNNENSKNTSFLIALIQLKVINDKKKNIERAEELIKSAVNLHKPSLVILPEFFNCPLGGEGNRRLNEFAEEEENSETLQFLKRVAKEHNIYLIGGSIPIKSNDKVYNTSFSIDRNGELKLTFKKLHLFDVCIPGKAEYKESKRITAGNKFGVFETEFGRIGVGICYDIRFPEYAEVLRKEYNVDMLVYPAAFSLATGTMHWELLARSRAIDNQLYVAMCSPSRNYDDPSDFQTYGHSIVVDPFGQIVSTTGYEEDILISRVDFKNNTEFREQIPIWKQKRWDLYNISKF